MIRALSALGLIATLAACEGSPPSKGVQRLPDNRNFTPQSREPGITISGHVDVAIVREF